MKDKPTGFPGFKVSPAAFFVDGVLNETHAARLDVSILKITTPCRSHEAELAKNEAADASESGLR